MGHSVLAVPVPALDETVHAPTAALVAELPECRLLGSRPLGRAV